MVYEDEYIKQSLSGTKSGLLKFGQLTKNF